LLKTPGGRRFSLGDLGDRVGADSLGMALSRHSGRRRPANGGTRDLRPRSWARNGPIGPVAVGLELGKEKGRKRKKESGLAGDSA
jgi:hypothetical protein